MKIKLSTAVISAIIIVLLVLIVGFALIRSGYLQINLASPAEEFCYPNGTCITGAAVVDTGEDGLIEFPDEPAVIEDEVPEEIQENVTVETPVVEEELDEGDYSLVIRVVEGELVRLNLQATDPDGDQLYYTFSEPLNEEGQWQTEKGDQGRYLATVEVSDGELTNTQDVLIIIESSNKAPVIELGDIEVDEGETIVLNPVVTDPDGDAVEISYSGFMGSDTYETGYDDAGDYEVTVTASDGENIVTKTISVVVNNVNRPPVLEELGDINVVEGELVEVVPVAHDPDNDPLAFGFREPLDNSGLWQTGEGDEGVYDVEVLVSDGELIDRGVLTIVVEAANKAPFIEPISNIEVDEGETIVLNPVVTDPDGDAVEITYSGFMTSNTKEVGYDTVTREESSNVFEVVITASDGSKQSQLSIDVTVNNINRPPQITGISQG